MATGSYFRYDDDIKIKYMYLTDVIREMGKLNTRSPIYCMKERVDSGSDTLDRMFLTSGLEIQYLQIRLNNVDDKVVHNANKRIRPTDHNVLHCLSTS